METPSSASEEEEKEDCTDEELSRGHLSRRCRPDQKKFPLLSQVSWCLLTIPSYTDREREEKFTKAGFDNQHFCSTNKGRRRGKFSFSQSNVGRSPNPLGAIIPPGDHRVISALVSVFSNATLALPPFPFSLAPGKTVSLEKGGAPL